MFERMVTWIQKNQDIIFVACIISVLVTIFVPLPTTVIDVMLVISITLSIMILLTVIYIREPLKFSVFPSLLLITTAYRLALNVATTRLILSNAGTEGTAAAGQVIETFGVFVAGNEALIGIIIFTILTIVNFIVITKGSNRISEVAARFTLDAMPGKQMAIDADLNAGLIKEQEARKRREAISKEADFYGAMDGASKFVRGDAVAGIIITLVNILGGILLGVFKYGLTLTEASRTFTLLTIGDGLVSQVPALIISLAAGLIVSRATAESTLGKEFLGQLFSDSKVLMIAAVFLGLLVFTPLPTVPLLLVAALVYLISRHVGAAAAKAVKVETDRKEREQAKRPEKVEELLRLDTLELEIGYGLIRLVDPNQGGTMLERVSRLRKQIALDLGLVVPPIRIRDNMQLEPNQYVFKVRGISVATGSIMPDHVLAIDSGATTGIMEGIKTQEPAFHLPAVWITEQQKQRAEAMAYTVVDATTVLATHLTELIKGHAPELLTRDDVGGLLKNLKETHPSLVEEVVPGVVKPGEVQKVLQQLLKEGVSIRDLGTILEIIADYAPKTKDPEIVTEYVRNALSRVICQPHLDKTRKMYVITLDPKLEDMVKTATERTERGSFLTLPPNVVKKISQSLSKEIERLMASGHSPLILCSPQVRYQIKKIADAIQPGITVLSYNEVVQDARVESLGLVSVAD